MSLLKCYQPAGKTKQKKNITSKDTNKSSFFQSKIFTVVKTNLFELITKDWVQHANEKINYAKHMVSKSLPQRRWQGLFKYLKKGFCAKSPYCAMRKATCYML